MASPDRGAPQASAISPGLSFYEAMLPERPAYPPLDGDARCDVCVVGGGFTGLSAAVHLAEAGADVRLVEGERVGDGASMRNGGQMGTGQRSEALELEEAFGPELARRLFDLAEEAKAHLHEFTTARGIDMRFVPGQMSVAHKRRLVPAFAEYAEAMGEQFGYPHVSFMDREETSERLGSSRYFGGVRDMGTGHIDPASLLVGTARAAAASGARIHEHTRATVIEPEHGGVRIETPRGTIRAERALVAVNGYGGSLVPDYARHVMPIRSFIGATEPLAEGTSVIPGGESVDDSRFVVRYFRRVTWPDGRSRLLFGGRETYRHKEHGALAPGDLERSVRKQIREVYPGLARIGLTHVWGGSVAVTTTRDPFVREVAPAVHAIGGFSGHGVMLSSFTGKLYAEAVAGNRDRLEAFEVFQPPAFPGGLRWRPALLALAMGWFALRDRF